MTTALLEPEVLLSFEDYLTAEIKAEFKSEYQNGKIRTMPYASKNHNIISANLTRTLGNVLENTPYIVCSGDMLVYMPDAHTSAYPDVLVIDDKDEYIELKKGIKSLLNPICVIEVLSESTEGYDRGKKFQSYQTIAYLQQYILISQTEMRVESFVKNAGNQWILTILTKPTDQLTILNYALEIANIYTKVKFEEKV
jgi:Uma2 family endonuclease